MKKLLIWVILIVVAFSSCTLQKRVYSSGFHIDWAFNHGDAGKQHKQSKAAFGVNQRKTSNCETGLENPAQAQSTQSQIVSSLRTQTRNDVAVQIVNPTNKNHTQFYGIGPFNRLHKSSRIAEHRKEQAYNNRLKTDTQFQGMKIRPGGSIFDTILLILGIILSILGHDKSSDRGRWGGRGSYFDWTVFFTVVGVCFAGFGFLMTAVGGSSMSPSSLRGMMGAFTIMATIFSGIGLIKSIRDYNDLCKYVSIGSFVLLFTMWIVGLFFV